MRPVLFTNRLCVRHLSCTVQSNPPSCTCESTDIPILLVMNLNLRFRTLNLRARLTLPKVNFFFFLIKERQLDDLTWLVDL